LVVPGHRNAPGGLLSPTSRSIAAPTPMPPDGCPDPPRHIAAAPTAPHSAPAPVAVPAVGVGRLSPALVAPGPEVLLLSSSGKRIPKRLSRSLHPPDARSCSGKSYPPLRYRSWIDKCK